MTEQTEPQIEQTPPPPNRIIPFVIVAAVVTILTLGALMVWRADSRNNKVALSMAPKPVTAVPAIASTFRPSRVYVGTLAAWVQASIGPQFVSAYVDTVLVRPGSVVAKGEVLATLDCRNANASSQAVAAQAQAIDARQKALASQTARVTSLLDGGFVSPNDVIQQTAQSQSELAQLQAERAKLIGTSLAVNDCILRAPFDGEIATRTMDPGAFVRPGEAIVSIIDRSVVRMNADAPEIDFAVVEPTSRVTIHVYATNQDLDATITRRAPSADASTRTVHFEIDVPDPKRQIPVGTTGEVHIEVGEPVPATKIPLFAASVRGSKATVFVVDGDVARSRTFAVLGESGGDLFVETTLAAGSRVVTEGRALLEDGDTVSAKELKPLAGVPAKAPDAQAVPEKKP